LEDHGANKTRLVPEKLEFVKEDVPGKQQEVGFRVTNICWDVKSNESEKKPNQPLFQANAAYEDTSARGGRQVKTRISMAAIAQNKNSK